MSQSIEWSDRLEIGHSSIDRQHKKLFELAAAMMGDKDQLRVMRTLAALSEYVVVHFRDEEQLLADIGYPGLEAHKKAHDIFRARLAKLYGNAGGMTLDAIAAEVRLLVNEWLANHILVVDQEYVPYLEKSTS